MKAHTIILASGAAVLAVVLGVPTVLLVRGIGQYSQADRQLGATLRDLQRYYQKEPFPTKSNVDVEERNVDEMNRLYDMLTAALKEGQVDPPRVTPSGFSSALSDRQNQLAGAAGKQGVSVPQVTHMGAQLADALGTSFSKYWPTGEIPPAPEVPRLMRQLADVEKLARVIFAYRCKELVRIVRDEFEKHEGRRPRGGARPDAGTPPAAKAEALFSKEHYTVEFRARESTVWGILNELARDDTFIVVTSAKFGKDAPDVLTAEETPAASIRDDVPNAARERERHDLRRVSGPDVERLLLVKLEIDIYRFGKETE